MTVQFHVMIDKLKSGVWKKAKAVEWDNGEFITLTTVDGYYNLMVHEHNTKYENIMGWGLNMTDSLNMKFEEVDE